MMLEESRKGQPFAQQICEKANGMSCLHGTAQRPRDFFVGATKPAIHLPWQYAVQYLLNLRTGFKLYDHRYDCDQDENII